jgi:hypothetical protein
LPSFIIEGRQGPSHLKEHDVTEPKIIVIGDRMAAVAAKLAEIDGVVVDHVNDDAAALEAMRAYRYEKPVEVPEFSLRFDQINNGHPRSFRKPK